MSLDYIHNYAWIAINEICLWYTYLSLSQSSLRNVKYSSCIATTRTLIIIWISNGTPSLYRMWSVVFRKLSKHQLHNPASYSGVEVTHMHAFCHAHISQLLCCFLGAKLYINGHTMLTLQKLSYNSKTDKLQPDSFNFYTHWTAATMLPTCCVFTKTVFVLLIVAATCQLAITAPIGRRCTTTLPPAWANLRAGLYVTKMVSFQLA